jgi:hypothetical protein
MDNILKAVGDSVLTKMAHIKMDVFVLNPPTLIDLC